MVGIETDTMDGHYTYQAVSAVFSAGCQGSKQESAHGKHRVSWAADDAGHFTEQWLP